MESAKSGHRTVSGRTQARKNDREGKTNPRSRALNRSDRASEYANFADEIRRELNPRGPLQRLVTDHLVRSAWKLKANLEIQATRDRGEKPDPDPSTAKGRIRSTELDRAFRSMKEALESLETLRARQGCTTESEAAAEAEEVPADVFPNEWPIVPSEEFVGPPEADPEIPSWNERLVYDFDVSEASPVVKGTWVTVAHVVSLIVDGWTWADILRSYPELSEDDIRTCVAYAMAEENTSL